MFGGMPPWSRLCANRSSCSWPILVMQSGSCVNRLPDNNNVRSAPWLQMASGMPPPNWQPSIASCVSFGHRSSCIGRSPRSRVFPVNTNDWRDSNDQFDGNSPWSPARQKCVLVGRRNDDFCDRYLNYAQRESRATS